MARGREPENGTVVADRRSSNGHCPLSPCNAHWWVIETPNGKVSVGVCKYCGEERGFYNWIREGVKK